MKKIIEVSDQDIKNLKMLRENISNFLKKSSAIYDNENCCLLDIAPQVHEGAKANFLKSKIYTLDIDKESGADYIADLCTNNSDIIPDNKFDLIVCTEVLEHTLQPFNAVNEIYRILKSDGIVLVSTPFNFRIHGPLPDCWRFTEHGLRALFSNFNKISIEALDTEDRDLMPIQYTLVAQK